jgi:hypothetical protein
MNCTIISLFRNAGEDAIFFLFVSRNNDDILGELRKPHAPYGKWGYGVFLDLQNLME